MARRDLGSVLNLCEIAKKYIKTVTGKDGSHAGIVRVITLSISALILAQEAMHGDEQDGDTGNTTDDGANNSAKRSQMSGQDRRCRGIRCVWRGHNSRSVCTWSREDSDPIEDE